MCGVHYVVCGKQYVVGASIRSTRGEGYGEMEITEEVGR